MAKFQYVGDGNQSPESIKFMGKIRFYLKGAYVEVDDAEIIKKLEGNKCFRVKTAAKKKTAAKSVEEKKTKTED